MSKLDDTLKRWQDTRGCLLNTKQALGEARAELNRLSSKVADLEALHARQSRGLAEAADALAGLLHSDVAGITGSRFSEQVAAIFGVDPPVTRRPDNLPIGVEPNPVPPTEDV